MKTWYKAFDVYVNSKFLRRMWSKNKAIELAQVYSADMYVGHRHTEVVDVQTGEIVFNT